MLRPSALVISVVFATIAACSDNNRPAAQVPEGGAVCPANAQTAQGSACNREGYSCSVGYLCPGEVWQQVACTCTGGKYACKDATGEDVGAMGPACASTPPDKETCGAKPEDMAAKDCKAAGYACYFQGVTCPNENGGKPYTDVCLCAPRKVGPQADGAPPKSGLAWNCEVHRCAQ